MRFENIEKIDPQVAKLFTMKLIGKTIILNLLLLRTL